MIRPPPKSPLFPYTPLSRSNSHEAAVVAIMRSVAGQSGDRARRIVTRRFQSSAEADRHDLEYWIQIPERERVLQVWRLSREDRKSTRLNSSHANISYAVFCL